MVDWQQILATAHAEPVDRARLQHVIDEAVGGTITSVERMIGGIGSVMHRVDIAGGGIATLALRRLLPEFGDDGPKLVREVRTHAVAASVVPVPEVRWSDPDGTTFGRPSLLMDFAPGRTMAPDLDQPVGQHVLGRTLAAIHSLPVAGAGHLPRPTEVDEMLGWFGRPSPSRLVDVAALESAVLSHGLPMAQPALLHGDLHGGNVLWDGCDVTAVLDWTGALIGDPWWDVAYAWMDTCLMFGTAAGDAVVESANASGTLEQDREVRESFWRGMALLRATPTPADWMPAYKGTGVTHLTTEILEERYTTMVSNHLEEHER